MQTTVQPERPPVSPKAPIFARNEAGWDRTLRVLLGVALLWISWGGAVTGTPGAVLKIVGFVPLLTGLIGWCPLYSVLGFSTRRASPV
jgi:hypothetical protein